jgi:hypothetical protein
MLVLTDVVQTVGRKMFTSEFRSQDTVQDTNTILETLELFPGLAQDRDKWRALVNAVLNLLVL